MHAERFILKSIIYMDDCLGQHSISFSFGFFFFWLIFEGAPTPVSPHALRERILG
jgi:hypothetical protein